MILFPRARVVGRRRCVIFRSRRTEPHPIRIRGVPPEEIELPLGKLFGITSTFPSSGDGVAFEVNIDATLLGFCGQFQMSDHRVLVCARDGPIGGVDC